MKGTVETVYCGGDVEGGLGRADVGGDSRQKL